VVPGYIRGRVERVAGEARVRLFPEPVFRGERPTIALIAAVLVAVFIAGWAFLVVLSMIGSGGSKFGRSSSIDVSTYLAQFLAGFKTFFLVRNRCSAHRFSGVFRLQFLALAL
jgi:hypothetical protein